MPKKLKELDDSGFRIVFFSNQGGIEKGKATVAELQSKVQLQPGSTTLSKDF